MFEMYPFWFIRLNVDIKYTSYTKAESTRLFVNGYLVPYKMLKIMQRYYVEKTNTGFYVLLHLKSIIFFFYPKKYCYMKK